MIKLIKKGAIKYLFVLGVVFALILILIINREPSIAVIKTDPASGAKEVLETTQIDITFNQDVNSKSINNISIKTKPQIEFNSTRLVNTYKIVPKAPLQNNTKYEIEVLYRNKIIYIVSFETSVFSQEDVLKYGALQSEDDFIYGQALKDVVGKYTWYTSLPIKTSSYIIYHDFEKMKFAITYLVPIQDSDQENALVKNALDNLKKIGVKEPIQYYLNKPLPKY